MKLGGGRVVGLGREKSVGAGLDQSTLYEILSELIKISLKEILDDKPHCGCFSG